MFFHSFIIYSLVIHFSMLVVLQMYELNVCYLKKGFYFIIKNNFHGLPSCLFFLFAKLIIYAYMFWVHTESLVSDWKDGSCQVANNILTVSFCSSKLPCGVFHPLASRSPHGLSVPGICQLSSLSGICVASLSPISAHRRPSPVKCLLC